MYLKVFRKTVVSGLDHLHGYDVDALSRERPGHCGRRHRLAYACVNSGNGVNLFHVLILAFTDAKVKFPSA
jgi:hypothetical protein